MSRTAAIQTAVAGGGAVPGPGGFSVDGGVQEGGQVVGTVVESCGVQDVVEDVCFILSDVCFEGEAHGWRFRREVRRGDRRQKTEDRGQETSGSGMRRRSRGVPCFFVLLRFFCIRKLRRYITGE